MNRFIASLVACLVFVTVTIAGAGTRSDYDRNGFMVFYDDNGDTLMPLATEVVKDDFAEESGGLDTNLWLATVDATGSAVVSGARVMTLTTTAAATDKVELATDLGWEGSKMPSFEVRARVSNPNNGAFFIGLSDARFEAADTLAFSLSGGTLTSTATDAVGFLVDSASTNRYTVKCVSVNNNTDGAITESGVSVANPLWATYRIDMDSDGNVSYWINNSKVASHALAVGPHVPLAGVVGVKTDSGALAKVLTVDRVLLWQGK